MRGMEFIVVLRPREMTALKIRPLDDEKRCFWQIHFVNDEHV